MLKFLMLIVVVLSSFFSNCQIANKSIDTLIVVSFDFDSYRLSNEAEISLRSLFSAPIEDTIYIHGYTDTLGSVHYNALLAEKRTRAVFNVFINNGVPLELILPIAKGELKNVSSNDARSVVVFRKKKEVKEDNELVIAKVDLGDWEKAKLEREEKIAERKKRKEEEEAAKKAKIREELTRGDVITIDGIEFVPGESALMEYSKPALMTLLNLLEENPDLKIEVQGHICCSKQFEGLDKSTGKYNLSEMRAKSVYDILINNGISKKRLSYKGYGNSRPLYPENNPENMQRNRRVSIQVITE
jgi:outer membrane protein OmpA-like peptidoglycan-associated protein